MNVVDKHYVLTLSIEKKRRYLVRREVDVQDLKSALSNHTYSKITEITHRIRGSARLFDFIELEALAIRLEKAAKASQHETIQALVSEFDTHVSELIRIT